MSGVKRWLKKDTGRVKIIVTSVPFVPDSKNKESNDKWGGYEEQRIELLEHIEKHQIERVMFFSGDIHASMSLELVSPTGLKIMSVISSSFFWPYPHPSSRSYKTRGVVKGGSSGDFEITNSSKVVTDDNFTKLKISLDSVDIQVFSRKGKLLDKSKRTF